MVSRLHCPKEGLYVEGQQQYRRLFTRPELELVQGVSNHKTCPLSKKLVETLARGDVYRASGSW